jgi:tetratricopeptide (TPR) repeat protein
MRFLVLFAAIGLIAQDAEELVARNAAAASEAMRRGDYAAAERMNRSIVRLRPKLAEAQVNLGLSLYLQKKYEEAIGAFEHGLKLKPEMANAWLFLGICEFNVNRPGQAIPPLTKFIAQKPEDFQGRYFLGLAHLALDQYPEAAESLLAARAADPRNVDVLYHLAQSYLGQARKDPVKLDSLSRSYEAAVEEIAAIDPQSFRIAQLRAGYFEASGKRVEAIQELETLLQHDPKVRGLHYTLGCLYIEARQYLDAEMSLDAPYPRTYFQLGHVYLALDKPSQALPLLEKAIQIEPGSAGLVWVDMGRAYRALNRSAKAVACFEKAIELGERSASVYYQLGMAARSAGDHKRSREALEMSQRLRGEEKPEHAAMR